MTYERLTPALAGAAALALVLGTPAFAQQQREAGTGEQSGQQTSTTFVTAEDAQNRGAAGQVIALLEQSQAALEQNDLDGAREALGQALEALQKAAVESQEDQLREIQAQLDEARAALEAEDAQTAESAIGSAAEALIVIEQESAEQAGQPAGQPGTATAQQVQGTTQTQPPATQGGGASQEALASAQDALGTVRQEIETALLSLGEAQAALQKFGTGMVEGAAEGGSEATLTIVEESETEAPGQRIGSGGAAAPGQAPRLSPEETNRLLGVGEREIGQASEVMTVTAGDLQDRDVITYEGENVGSIEQIVSSRDAIYAIVEHGGFLGIGENSVAIPIERLGMRGDEVVLLGLTQEQLEQMPEYDYEADQELTLEDPVEIGRYN